MPDPELRGSSIFKFPDKRIGNTRRIRFDDFDVSSLGVFVRVVTCRDAIDELVRREGSRSWVIHVSGCV